MISVLLLGVLIGARHALEADHIAAVASLATQARGEKEMVRLGVNWGIGHTITLIAVGSAVLALDALVPEHVARWLEIAVGVMLVVLGADVIRRALRDRVHFHAHRHGNLVHFHAHSHRAEAGRDDHDHVHPKALRLRALVVGVVHGMAGSAALVLLTLHEIKSFWLGIIYILLFGAGSIAGMALLSFAISLPLRFTARRFIWVYNGLTGAVGVVTLFLGGSIVFDVLGGFV